MFFSSFDLPKIACIGILALSRIASAEAQADKGAPPPTASSVPLTVEKGAPINIIVTNKVRYKDNEPVHARVVDPVFAFDREVIPAGTEVLGRISGFQKAPRWQRFIAISSGNFTPLREPRIEFGTLVLKDRTILPIQTAVTPGADFTVRFDSGETARRKGRVASAAEAARQEIEARKRAVIDAVKAPGKLERLKEQLWTLAPYHRQYLASGARFKAMLESGLEFGTSNLSTDALTEVNSHPPAGSVVSARLITDLDSRTATHGMDVEAVLSRPLFSADNHLIFPEGSRLHGSVVQAQAARRWHRDGKLAFMFTRIEPPSSLGMSTVAQEIEGRLETVEVDSSQGKVQMDEEGGVSGASSKTRFIAPGIAVVMAMQSADGLEGHHDNDMDRLPARPFHNHNHYGSRMTAGGFGAGLMGVAIGRLSRPLAPVLGFYGAGRSVYTNVVARGKEIKFPRNTAIEIHFGPHLEAQ